MSREKVTTLPAPGMFFPLTACTSHERGQTASRGIFQPVARHEMPGQQAARRFILCYHDTRKNVDTEERQMGHTLTLDMPDEVLREAQRAAEALWARAAA
jgi:hypothetical protein